MRMIDGKDEDRKIFRFYRATLESTFIRRIFLVR